MKSTKLTVRSIFKGVMLFAVAAFVMVNMVFYIFQEAFLLERYKLPEGYEEKIDVKPSFDASIAPPGKMLPATRGDWSPDEVAINFQKYESLVQPTNRILLYLHGNRGSVEQCRWEIEPFLREGYSVWTMDYRGFGKSQGVPTERRLLGDAKMVYEQILKSDEIDIIWGRSFGSGLATYLATIKSPKRLVLETPYWSLPDAACHNYPFLLPLMFRYRLPTYEYMEYVQCPVHMIHGTDDKKIYFESSTSLDELCGKLGISGKLYEIPHGKHNLRPSKDNPMPTDADFSSALISSLDLRSETSRKPL